MSILSEIQNLFSYLLQLYYTYKTHTYRFLDYQIIIPYACTQNIIKKSRVNSQRFREFHDLFLLEYFDSHKNSY